MSGRNSRIVRNRDRSSGIDFISNNSKIIVGIVVVFLIIIIGIILLCSNFKSSKIVGQEIKNNNDIEYEYFMLSSDENIGVIDKKGNKIIDTKYIAIDIPNPSKDVFFCYSDDETVTILNKNAEEILNNYQNVQIIQSTNENSEIEKNALKYKNGEFYGLIDLDGNIVTEAIYSELVSLNDKPGAILAKKDDKYGVLDSKGNLIIDFIYDGIFADGYNSAEDLYTKTGYIVSQKDNDGVKYGYIDYKGNLLLDTKYESLERALEYSEDDIYLIVMQKGKKGVFKNKKKIIDLNFQDINYSDLSNVFIVNKNGKYGFCNKQGKMILKPEYTDYSIAGNYISVEKDAERKLFDINGNLVNSASYTKMIETENPSYFIAEDEDGYYSIISKDVNIDEKFVQVEYAYDNYFIFQEESGKSGIINAITEDVEVKAEYDFIILIEGTNVIQAINGTENTVDIYSKDLIKTVTMKDGVVETLENGYSVVYSETDMKYIDKEGNVVKNTDVYPEEELYSIQQAGKWGFANSNDEIVIECKYDIVTEFNKYGFAGVKKAGKWGVVQEDGTLVVEPNYEIDIYYFPQFIGKYQLFQSEIIYCIEQ